MEAGLVGMVAVKDDLEEDEDTSKELMDEVADVGKSSCST